MADLEFTADFTDLQLMRRELLGVAKDAKQSAGVFEREYRKVERQIEQTAKASQTYYNEVLKVGRASKSASASADVFNRELSKQEANVERLRAKYVPLYAVSKQYERSLEEIKQAHQQGILTANQYDTALENLNNQFAIMNTQAVGNTRSMNAMGMATQQVGYQVGDFLVQVQSGTNWMVAFGQQATQLVGVLPMMAEQFNMNVTRLIGISAALGIAIPLVTAIGAAWMRTREDSEDSLTTTQRHVESLEQDLQRLIDKIDLVGSSYSNITRLRTQEELIRLQAEYNNLVAENPKLLTASEKVLSRTLALEYSKFKELQSQISSLEELTKKYDEAEKSVESMEARSKSFSDIMQSISIDGLLSQMDSLNSKLGSAVFGAGTLTARLRGAFDTAVAAAERAAYAQQIGGGRSMGRGGPTAKEIQNYDPRAQIAYTPGGSAGIPLPKIRGSSGGGGGSAKTQEDYVGKLLKEAEQKRKLIGLSEEETRRQEILYQLREKGLPTDDKRIEQVIQLEAETRKLMEAEQQREQMMQTITSNIESAFMTVVDGSKSVEEAFRGMLRNIILAIYQQQVAKPAATAIGNIFSRVIPSFDGGGFTGYGSRSGGMDGKGGMLAMVHPNETVVDHSKGQSMGSVVVNNHFNFSANGDESVKRIIRGEVPRITEATKAAVLDAKRRGGSYGRSF